MRKTTIYLFMSLIFSFCSDNNLADLEKNETITTVETIENTKNVQNFKMIASAFDNIDIKSKESLDVQMMNYLDKEYSNLNLKKEINALKKRNDFYKLNSSNDIEINYLDEQLNNLNLSDRQKEYFNRIMILYSEEEKTPSIDEIKVNLLNIKNEITKDSSLNSLEKEQMYNLIDGQSTTILSVYNYVYNVNKEFSDSVKKFSLRKILNQVITIVVGIVVGAAIAGPNLIGQIIGGVIVGAIVANNVFRNNSCIKICGTGYCNTSFFNCNW